MKLLKDILYKVRIEEVIGSMNVEVNNIVFDSRKIKKGYMFVAVQGSVSDGHTYILEAINQGAKVIVLEKMPNNISEDITYIKVQNSNNALAIISSHFYDNPSEKIQLIGVTGTNGKTTIVHLLHQLFTFLGVKAGMISTIRNQIIEKKIPTNHTTPDVLEINCLLNKMIDSGCQYCFMEVSSHGISQLRIKGLRFAAGIFTNITHDHLDYHKDFDDYIDVKKSFFDSLSESAIALFNKDDKNGLKMVESTRAKKFSYSLKSVSDYKCKVIESQFEGMLLNINNIDIWVKLIGSFNAYNILAAYSIAHQFNFSENEILTGLSLIKNPEGRVQSICLNEIIAIVDYAHTEDALKNVLSMINDIRNNTEQLITVFGCGGDRDKKKRVFMTKTACELSTQVILTSDNPRSEDPDLIITDMMRELDPAQKKKVFVITDRRKAIKKACKLARSKDIILVAGKGHEKYQEIKGRKLPFDDLQELKHHLI